MLAKFTVDISPETPAVSLGDTELEPIDISEDGRVAAECEQTALAMASFEGFPEALTVQVHGSDGFGTYLFHQAEIYRDSDGQLIAEHVCHEPNKYWEGTWGLATFLRAIADQAPFFPDVRIGEIELEDDWKRLTVQIPLDEGAAFPALHKTAGAVKRMMREAEIALAGMQWKPEYAKDERVFCEEILAPLLRRMKFISVRYTQGAREYG
jgi:hypothetical protein